TTCALRAISDNHQIFSDNDLALKILLRWGAPGSSLMLSKAGIKCDDVRNSPMSGHSATDANGPMGTLRPWLAETHFRVIMHAPGLWDGVIFRLFPSKSLLQPRTGTPRSLSTVAAHCS